MIAIEVQKNAKDYQCQHCYAKHCDSEQLIKGSIGAANFKRYEIPNVMASNTCFLPMISALSYELLNLYRHYKNGVLIRAGGLFDQPNKYIKAMGIIDGQA